MSSYQKWHRRDYSENNQRETVEIGAGYILKDERDMFPSGYDIPATEILTLRLKQNTNAAHRQQTTVQIKI